MLEDALDFADLAEQFSKQDSAKQGGCYNVSTKQLILDTLAATVKKDKKNSVLDSRKTYNICKCRQHFPWHTLKIVCILLE